MTGLYVESRPFPGHVPLPPYDRKATARQQLEATRRRIAGRAPCPPTCPECFGGHAEATGRWEWFGHAIGRCEGCDELCRSTDPAGVVRHPPLTCGAATMAMRRSAAQQALALVVPSGEVVEERRGA